MTVISKDQANAWSFFIGDVEMCYGDLVNELRRHGFRVTESQIRYAISSGKVTRPEMDGSFRFKYSTENVAEIVRFFQSKLAAKV